MKSAALSIFSLACLAMTPTGAAGDTQVPLPSGWTANHHFFAAARDRVAVALERGDPATEGSRVLQYDLSGTTIYTDIVGRISSLTYAPDGGSLLVSHGDEDGWRATLLDPSGAVSWTKEKDERAFFFSTTGEAVYAWNAGGETGYGKEVEVFDLGGTTIRKVRTGTPMFAVLVVGNGDGAILGTGATLMRVRTTDDKGIEWTVHSDPANPILDLADLGRSEYFVAEQGYGHFEVRNLADGSLVYDYDPDRLATAGGGKTEIQYAQYDPFATPSPTGLLLSDNTSDGMSLDLSTGALVPVAMDVSAPPGFELLREIRASTRLLIGPGELRIRQIETVD